MTLSLNSWSVNVAANVISTSYQGSFAITGGVQCNGVAGAFGVRTALDPTTNVFDIRYSFRLAYSSDAGSIGTADFHYGIATVMPSLDVVASYIPGSAVAKAVEGSFGINGTLYYNPVYGSFDMLGQVISPREGSFTISIPSVENVTTGSFLSYVENVFTLKDAEGSYGLYSVVEGVVIKIDVVDDSIKAALMLAGVKFS